MNHFPKVSRSCHLVFFTLKLFVIVNGQTESPANQTNEADETPIDVNQIPFNPSVANYCKCDLKLEIKNQSSK